VIASAISSSGVLQQIVGSDLVLVTDVATAIERAEKLLSLIDVPGPPVTSALFRLEYLSASQARAQIDEFLDAIGKAATGETRPPKLVLLPDERLNTLRLFGPEGEVRGAEEFLKTIDRELPRAKRVIQYYKLKNVPAESVADGLRRLLGLAIAARQVTPIADRPRRREATIAGATRAAPRSRGGKTGAYLAHLH
jgi:type II secretory pathway component GspD/PulD (secretin)